MKTEETAAGMIAVEIPVEIPVEILVEILAGSLPLREMAGIEVIVILAVEGGGVDPGED